MKKNILTLFIILVFLWPPYWHFVNGQTTINWKAWKSLPNNAALEKIDIPNKQPGVAGAYSGESNDALIVAGGANFPYDSPWSGGEKVWWKDIYVLDEMEGNRYKWVDSVFSLPISMAYGVSIVYANELICVGGENENGIISEVVGLTWNAVDKEIKIRSLTSLPEGFRAVNGDICEGEILVHGIQKEKNKLLRLDSVRGEWVELPGCPGPPRAFSVGQSQSNGRVEGFYLFSGRTVDANGQMRLLKDGYMYDPVQESWVHLGNISKDDAVPICIMGASSVKVGANHILVFGGDNGRELVERSRWSEKIEEATDSVHQNFFKAKLDSLFVNHKGFSPEILSYHTVTNSWVTLDTFPAELPVTTNAIHWNSGYLISSGEIHPGIRTPAVWLGKISGIRGKFGWINYAVVVLYFVVMILIGVKYARRQKSTEDYFKGGGRIPWWAAGLSLFGTSLSAITFMAIPAKTYMTDWGYFFFQMTPLLTAPIFISVYIPYFRRLNITSAYEYLENRFNLLTRLLGSLSFMILQLGRVGIVLFLPSIAINLVTGISIEFCILVMGVVSIIYTMMGGIEAVIWTDVLQVVVLMGGTFLCLVVLFTQMELTVSESFHAAVQGEKFRILDTAFDFTWPTIWVVVLGGFFANLITSGSDQTMVQRYLTTTDEQEAKRSVWTFALLAIPATLIFFTIGTTLYLYYSGHPARLNPTISNVDAIFPWYIVTELPRGVSGLLVAGIFSAAMSSLSSSMNSVSTAFITDFIIDFHLDL